MGIYYDAVCDEKRERIEPGHINDLGIKAYAIAFPTHPFGPVVIFAMLSRWRNCAVRLQADESCPEDVFDYKDVTAEVVAAYVEHYKEHAVLPPAGSRTEPEPIRYTGKPGRHP